MHVQTPIQTKNCLCLRLTFAFRITKRILFQIFKVGLFDIKKQIL